MDFLVNDLSFHGQFFHLNSFRDAISRVMAIRQIVLSFGRAVHCHRSIAQAAVTPTMRMPQAAQALTLNERRALLQWLTQHGPFWEDVRNHKPEDWYEWNGRILTDTAVGEAAWCCLNGIERALMSLSPSDWEFSPVSVEWVCEVNRTSVDVANYWDPATIETRSPGRANASRLLGPA